MDATSTKKDVAELSEIKRVEIAGPKTFELLTNAVPKKKLAAASVRTFSTTPRTQLLSAPTRSMPR